jgi:hypothetical protein
MRTMIMDPGLTDTVWKDIEPFLQDAIDESAGELELGTLKRRIEDKSCIALCAIDEDVLLAIGILEKATYPSGKTVLGIVALGGTKMEDWVEAVDEALMVIGEQQECDEIRIVGRPGWSKALKNLGWESTHVIVSKKVGE